jgi:hypothetical protein
MYDPFAPKFKTSVPLDVTQEQSDYIKAILDVACSDSKFAEKAYAAITLVLAAGMLESPIVTSVTPATVVLGEPSFTLVVTGSGFNPYSVIRFNGLDELTTFVSETEVQTGVNMPLWQAPVVVPVAVRNFSEISASVNFEFLPVVPALASILADKNPKQMELPFDKNPDNKPLSSFKK